jgi:phosphoglycolate phosphatase
MKKVLSSYDFIIFDLDGTLVDSKTEIYLAFDKVVKRNNLIHVDENLIFSLIGVHPKEFFKHAGVDEIESDFYVSEFRQNLVVSEFKNTFLFKDSRELLELLKDLGKRTAIATTKPTHLARQLCDAVGITHLLDHIQGTDDKDVKPNPAVIFKCLEKIDFQNVVMVGDTEDDINAAKAAKIDSIALNHGSRTLAILEFSQPTFLMDNISELFQNTMEVK